MPTQTRRRRWYDHASAGAVPMEVGIGRSGSDRRPVPRSQLPQDRRWPVTIDRGGLRRGDKEEVSVLREAARKMQCHCGIFCQYFKNPLVLLLFLQADGVMGADGNRASAGANVTAPIQRWHSRNGGRVIAGRDREDAAIAPSLILID